MGQDRVFVGIVHRVPVRLAKKAEEMAAILRRACPTGCEELDALDSAIEAYRKSGGEVKWNK